MIPVAAVGHGITELEGAMVVVLPDDVVIPVCRGLTSFNEAQQNRQNCSMRIHTAIYWTLIDNTGVDRKKE